MEYSFPGNGYETINDQFMLGENILVAPVVEKGQFEKEVSIPEGEWVEQNTNKVYTGPCKVKVPAPLEVLPWFIKNT